MCGIAGFIDFNKNTGKDVLVRMADSLLHRGPDDSGYEMPASPHAAIGFGFRRLAIIDLSPLGHQPMKFEEAGLTITFNGEIYNYREIRKELEGLGYTFKSGSDTEVILKSYHKWGATCVERFIGMFAIAINDEKNEKVVLFRDRAGVKPLYWYQQNNLLLWGSELKALIQHPGFKKELDYNALSLYFQRGYISAPYSIFKNTRKLLPGHLLEIDLKAQKATEKKYWDVIDCYNQPKLNTSYEDARNEMEKLMVSAFQYRMVADVPVGVFLSGGYDSTAVTALLQANSGSKIKTFTIGFDDPKFNEAHHAKQVAEHLGTEHHELTCTYKDALDIVPQWADIYDEPFGDISGIPTTLVSRMARKQVTVALSADGGDEIFAGYPKYFNAVKRINSLDRVPGFAKKALSKLIPAGSSADIALQNKQSKLKDYLAVNDVVKKFDIISQAMTFFETQQLFAADIQYLHTPFDEGGLLNNSNNLLSKFQATEYKTYMVDDILQKVDRATMSISLEGREPFLDQRIIELAARLPENYKYRNGIGKFILKDITHKYVPQQIMERPKMGFGVPLETWLKADLKGLLTDVINEKTLKEQGVFNSGKALQLRDSYLSNRPVEFQRLSYLFLFGLWWNRWMK
ncbi:MAG TPA: asparagine synthase (glutamine-hydrolyzing) [Chitinophagales bacterium]|nr:asparagine synthase (glutamine-hydrolyzing) [Chitinophagales bacterium]